YYERVLCPIDQLRRGRTTWRSAFATYVAESFSGSSRQTCVRLSRHRPRFRRNDLRLPWTGGTDREGLHQEEQADLSSVRSVGERKCEVTHPAGDRETQRSRARP